MSESEDILQYVPFKSFVHPSFWYKLSEIKLEVDKLNDAPKKIFGYFTNQTKDGCVLEVDYSAFNSDFVPPKNCFTASGMLYNKNTIEEFKSCDKNALLTAAGEQLFKDLSSQVVLDDPSLLFRFIILSFADLKTHKYYYWFAFPLPMEPIARIMRGVESNLLENVNNYNEVKLSFEQMPYDKSKLFFLLETDDANTANVKYADLRKVVEKYSNEIDDANLQSDYFCFSDLSQDEHPSWLLRAYICFLFYNCNGLRGKAINVIGFRESFDSHFVWKLKIPAAITANANKFVGWETNANGKMGPRCASMSETMDPTKLADSAVNLNLKLMKWRVLPELNIDRITSTKCLLFGAGTLGCAVARNLMAWGFKHVTFVDNGHVSLSNPARQSLYRHEDALSGQKMKAPTAADRLKEINPNAISHGFCLQIPMPGHTIGDIMYKTVNETLDTIEEQIKSHDAIFLLTDSRESRWLPALLGAYHRKTVINAALGFDTYMVMRHGSRKSSTENCELPTVSGLHCIPGSELGCYFCNDVTAPGDSSKDRTLDQQCTVTRPGVSNIAASYAVELLMSLLQHKNGDLAPAYFFSKAANNVSLPEGILGVIPHSIRGSLSDFENILPACTKFSQCIACSEKVLKEYEEKGKSFLFQVFESNKYLEDLTGISELGGGCAEILEYDSDEEFEIN